jgi:4-carboxymuconolactone decarboxylase
VRDRWGAVGVVELTTLIGYYTLVSMTLNAHHIPLPDGAAPPLAPCDATRATPGLGTGLTDIAGSTVRTPTERRS